MPGSTTRPAASRRASAGRTSAPRRLLRERGIRHEICGKVIVATTESETVRLAALARAPPRTACRRSRSIRPRSPRASRTCAGSRPCSCRRPASSISRALPRPRFRPGELRATCAAASPARRRTLRRRPPPRHHRGRARRALPRQLRRPPLRPRRALAGVEPTVRIVPFRGEYYRLRQGARALVRHLVYPLPDPAFPFLGVHLHARWRARWCGPNAVLATRREGYRRRDVSLRDSADVFAFGGFWRLAARLGGRASPSSSAPPAGVASWPPRGGWCRRLPSPTFYQPLPACAPGRGPGRQPGGRFPIVDGERSLHVLNAPSPAATSCLPIGEYLAERVAVRS
jgi:L-2-hydroxyglutarate oxidase